LDKDYRLHGSGVIEPGRKPVVTASDNFWWPRRERFRDYLWPPFFMLPQDMVGRQNSAAWPHRSNHLMVTTISR